MMLFKKEGLMKNFGPNQGFFICEVFLMGFLFGGGGGPSDREKSNGRENRGTT